MLNLSYDLIVEIFGYLTKSELIPLLSTPVLRSLVVEHYYGEVFIDNVDFLKFLVEYRVFPKFVSFDHEMLPLILESFSILNGCKIIEISGKVKIKLYVGQHDHLYSFLSSIGDLRLSSEIQEIEVTDFKTTFEESMSNENVISVKSNDIINYEQFPKLKQIEVGKVYGSDLKIPTSVSKLKIDHVESYVQFPDNLKELIVEGDTMSLRDFGHKRLEHFSFATSSQTYEVVKQLDYPHLKSLALSGNLVLECVLPTNLRQLTLNGSLIKKLPLPNLKQLTLINCKLLNKFELPPYLQEFEIKNCNCNVELESLKYLKKLKMVDRLQKLGPLPESLEELDLSWNKLTDLVIDLPKLKRLNLLQNFISKIEITADSLKHLNLSSNSIETIHLNLPVLTYLDILINKISEISLNTPHLKFIDLSRNNLNLEVINDLPKTVTFIKFNLNRSTEPISKVCLPPNLYHLQLNRTYLTKRNFSQLIPCSIVNVELFKTEIARSGILHELQGEI